MRKSNPQRRITKNNYKQAMVPEGAIVLDNHNGTSPGLILEKKGKNPRSFFLDLPMS